MTADSRRLILARMLARLPTQRVPAAGGGLVTPLAALTTRDRGDPAIAILDAWAYALDVASFYLERIDEEGYRSTAREHRSLLELTRTVGYSPGPGLAAATALAFTVLAQPGMPASVRLPAGVKVQAVTGQAGAPRVFETVEALDGRPEWNALRPAPPPAAPVKASATELALAAPAALRAGQRILVVADDGSPGQRYAPLVAGPGGGRSVALQAPLYTAAAGPEPGSAAAVIGAPAAFTLPEQFQLFGYDAPPLPDDLRPRTGGVYRYDPGTGAWEPRHHGLPSGPVLALASIKRQDATVLFAAAAGHGVFRSADLGASWRPTAASPAGRGIRALGADDAGVLYAGGDDGTLLRSRDDGDSWQQLGTFVTTGGHLPIAPVYALATGPGIVYAGTDDGVFASTDGGVTWVSYLAVPGTRTMATMAAASGAVVACGTTVPGYCYLVDPPKDNLPVYTPVRPPVLAGQFPRALTATAPGLPGQLSDLAILTDDRLILAGWPQPAVSPPVTGGLALTPDGQGGLMVALAPGAFLEPADWPSLAALTGQHWVDLDRVVSDVTAGRWLVLARDDQAGAWPVTRSSTVLRSDFGRQARVTRVYLGPGRPLNQFLGPGVRTTVALLSGPPLPLATKPLNGRQISLDQAIPPLLPGRRLIATGPPGTGELLTVEAMDDDHTITLAEPLAGGYEAGSFTLHANVALATDGESVTEVLGSGDGTAGQRFTLAHPSLTYVPAATGTGSRSTLTVSVDGVPWREAATLNDCGVVDQVYLTRQDSDGRTQVIFGDGVHGARPPAGDDNITAVYRHGLGPEGNVPERSLVLMPTRPLGAQDVTNPLPATGGVAAEADDALRTRMSQWLLAMDRLVALTDFEQFATGFAGIAAAQATALSAGGTRLLYLTVAGTGGEPVPEGSLLYDSLAAAIDARRPLGQPLRIGSYGRLLFGVAATLRADRRRDPAAVRAAAEDAIRTTFAVGTRNFGQPVYRGELIALLQAVSGVIAVTLDGLWLAGEHPVPRPVLTCHRARWADGTALPAQLLVPGPVMLGIEAAG